jgi:hypothetical protein
MHWHSRTLQLISALVVLFGSAANSADRTIYRCIQAGVVTYSDRPCDSSPQVYSLDAPEIPVARPLAKATGTPPQRMRQQRSTAVKSGPRIDSSEPVACERTARQLRRLRAQMRAGYNVATGERLRAAEREARARLRDLHCRSPRG